jgi:hypothetical protein
LLDGIMHRDTQPLMPFAQRNPYLGLIGIGTLHLLCVLSGALGVALLALGSDGWRSLAARHDTGSEEGRAGDDAPTPESVE